MRVVRDNLFDALLDRLDRYLCRVHLLVPLAFKVSICLAGLVTVETVFTRTAHEYHRVGHPVQCFVLLNQIDSALLLAHDRFLDFL